MGQLCNFDSRKFHFRGKYFNVFLSVYFSLDFEKQSFEANESENVCQQMTITVRVKQNVRVR